MGIPYSREINAAFSQVTPLVASGYDVLNTTKNIAVALFVIEIVSVFLLSAILLGILALLITMNPDLAHERDVLVTPAMRWIASWHPTNFAVAKRGVPLSVAAGMVVVFMVAGWVFLGYVYYKRKVEDATVENQVGEEQEGESETEMGQKGKDVENVKKGDTEQ